MKKTIRTEKELGEALKNEQSFIEIEGDLAQKVIRIRATGRVAWLVAIGGITIALAGVVVAIPSGGTGGLAGAVGGSAAITVLGLTTFSAAVAISKSAGSVEALNQLREYQVVAQSSNKLVLKK